VSSFVELLILFDLLAASGRPRTSFETGARVKLEAFEQSAESSSRF